MDFDLDIRNDSGFLTGVKRVVHAFLDRCEQSLGGVVESEEMAILGEKFGDRDVSLFLGHRRSVAGRAASLRVGRSRSSRPGSGHLGRGPLLGAGFLARSGGLGSSCFFRWSSGLLFRGGLLLRGPSSTASPFGLVACRGFFATGLLFSLRLRHGLEPPKYGKATFAPRAGIMPGPASGSRRWRQGAENIRTLRCGPPALAVGLSPGEAGLSGFTRRCGPGLFPARPGRIA